MCRYSYLKTLSFQNTSADLQISPHRSQQIHLTSTSGTSFWHNLEPWSLPRDDLGPILGRGPQQARRFIWGTPNWVHIWHPNSPKSRKVRLWKPSWNHLWKSHRKEQIPTSSKSLKHCFHTRGVATMNKSRFLQKVSK